MKRVGVIATFLSDWGVCSCRRQHRLKNAIGNRTDSIMHRSRTCTDTIQGRSTDTIQGRSTDSIIVIGANPGARMSGVSVKNGAKARGAGANGEIMRAGNAIVGVAVIIGETKAG